MGNGSVSCAVVEPAYTLYTNIDDFMSVDVSGDASPLIVSERDCMHLPRALRHYKKCKATSPSSTSAAFCVPSQEVCVAWFKGMHKANPDQLSPLKCH